MEGNATDLVRPVLLELSSMSFPAPGQLIASLTAHFDDLDKAGFGFFHRAAALFFDFFDNEPALASIRTSIQEAMPSAVEKAYQYKVQASLKLEVANREQIRILAADLRG